MVKMTELLSDQVKFLNPQYLDLIYIFVIISFLGLTVLIVSYLNRVRKSIGSRHSIVRKLKFWSFVSLATISAIIALSRPYLPKGSVEIKKGDIEVVVLLDNSASMWVKDILPSRIDIATREITNLYSYGVLREGDRAALVLFGMSSTKRLRLSRDLDLFAREVSRIGRPKSLTGSISSWGSDVPLVLEDTYSFLDKQDSGGRPSWRPIQKSNRIVLLFGDGDYQLDDKERIAKALAEFKTRGLKIFTIGIGSKKTTRLDSVLNDYNKGVEYDQKLADDIKDQVTSLNPVTLDLLARNTGGRMMTIEDEGANAEQFLADAINTHRSSTIGAEYADVRVEFWHEFIYLALIFFVLGIMFL